MERERFLPDQGKLSTVTAMILLAYASAAFFYIPQNAITIQLPGFLFVAKLNFYTIVSVVAAAMAAAGSDWVISSHPNLGEGARWHHWILPALTALVIGVPLNEIAVSAAWWVVFALGGLLFVIVLVSEYVSVDLQNALYPAAIVSLTVVSLAMFLVLAIAVRGAGLRLYAVFSAILPAAALVSARTLNLRMMGNWFLQWIIGITLVVGQLAICLFYLPLKPIPFGLILLGGLYALMSLVANIEEGNASIRLWIEPTLVFAVFVFLSILL
jgi:hypothetical protein